MAALDLAAEIMPQLQPIGPIARREGESASARPSSSSRANRSGSGSSEANDAAEANAGTQDAQAS